ncbi:unnamed protein product [Mytilus edulis]|uniref:Uncharacterized protein n=1 Tax=Mytilus edulis TaxID=6550 RepID=A0A8S3TV47_MYTED|nr:unnamed protein product [Mytilus edulis]
MFKTGYPDPTFVGSALAMTINKPAYSAWIIQAYLCGVSISHDHKQASMHSISYPDPTNCTGSALAMTINKPACSALVIRPTFYPDLNKPACLGSAPFSQHDHKQASMLSQPLFSISYPDLGSLAMTINKPACSALVIQAYLCTNSHDHKQASMFSISYPDLSLVKALDMTINKPACSALVIKTIFVGSALAITISSISYPDSIFVGSALAMTINKPACSALVIQTYLWSALDMTINKPACSALVIQTHFVGSALAMTHKLSQHVLALLSRPNFVGSASPQTITGFLVCSALATQAPLWSALAMTINKPACSALVIQTYLVGSALAMTINKPACLALVIQTYLWSALDMTINKPACSALVIQTYLVGSALAMTINKPACSALLSRPTRGQTINK